MALLLLLFLPSFPFTATFLTPRQRAIAQVRVSPFMQCDGVFDRMCT